MVFGLRCTCSDVSVINSAHTMQLASSTEALWSSELLRSPVFHSGWCLPLQLFSVLLATSFLSDFLINAIEWWLSGTIRKSRGAKLVPMLPVSPVNKAESVPCSFIGTVCCEHVPSPSSLHLKAFQALRNVFCQNNYHVVYPRGSFDAQTYKTTPSPFLSITTVSRTIVFAEKNQLLKNHQNRLWKKKVKTH